VIPSSAAVELLPAFSRLFGQALYLVGGCSAGVWFC